MIGILGGTFDPIHRGHVRIASQVCASLSLRQLQFMPCAIPVHRGQPHSSAQHRLAMIERVVAGHPGLAVNTIELDRAGASYSIDSLQEIHASQPLRPVLVLGADAFNGFPDWKQPGEILKLAHLVVCARPGVEIDSDIFAEHRVDSAQQLFDRPAGAILRLDLAPCDCSSSALRASLARGEFPEDCLEPAVIEYIQENNLYRSTSD